jgi:GT2 family glycosyltransferase
MPKISVVIPTYNSIGQIEPLLNQLNTWVGAEPACARGADTERAAAGAALTREVIIADDASPDGTASWLAEQYPWLTVNAGDRNLGFGANVMRGVSHSTSEYLFLLNSDVELCGDPITPLVELLEGDDSIFAAMPLIYNTHLGIVENLARLYCHRGLCWHTELTEQAEWTAAVKKSFKHSSDGGILTAEGGWNPPPLNQKQLVPPIKSVLCGAAFLCRRDRFLQLGGFDPRYKPFYWEDVALGFAAGRRSWRTVTVPQALVVHRHSESISAKVGERKLRYLVLNQLRFVHHYRRDLHALGLKRERLWWLARSGRALGKGDLQMASKYLLASLH